VKVKPTLVDNDLLSLSKRPPLNGRELTYYFLIAAVLLFGTTLTAAAFWYLNPPEPGPIDIGTVADFPPASHPYLVKIEELGSSIFIVNTGEEILALDRRTPFTFIGRRCYYAWVEANGRFEDPCSGSKFTLNGRLIQSPAPRNLDQYPVTIKNGRLLIDPTQLILGQTAEPLCYLTNECP
jgi:nitrite reductase/ring-hydroxylating ferredoxin subunit